MSIPVFRSAGTWAFTANNVANGALSPGAPSGKAVGDLLILVCETSSNTATVSTPSGWNIPTGFPKRSGTSVGGTIYVFTRIADGTASDTPSPSWASLTTGTTGTAAGAGILAYRLGSETLDGTVQVSDLSAQTTTSVIPAFTTATDNSLVIGIAVKMLESSGQTSTVATFTERADNSTTSGTGHVVEVSDKVITSHGSSGTATVTWSATTSARALTVSLGLKALVISPIDTGLTITDAIVTNITRAITDTGLANIDSIGRGFSKIISDTGFANYNGFPASASGQTFGSTTSVTSIAVPFTPINNFRLNSIIFNLKTAGSPSDQVQIQLQTNSGNLPSGVVIATTSPKTISGGTTATNYTFDFASPQTLAANISYWLIIQRTGSIDASNNYIALNSTASAASWAKSGANTGARLNVSTWQALGFNSAYMPNNDYITLGPHITPVGDIINDATRTANTQGDGIVPPDSSYGLWRGSTNLVTNGGFEVDTSGWTGDGDLSGTIARITSDSKFGSACLQYTPTITEDGIKTAITVSNTTVYTYSAWIKATAGISITMSAIGISGSGETIVTDGTWQRLAGTGTTTNTILTIFIVNNTDTTTFKVDGVQLEQQPYATPYIETNGGTANRVASYVTAPTNIITAAQGWVAARVRSENFDSITENAFISVEQDSTHGLAIITDGSQYFYIANGTANSVGGVGAPSSGSHTIILMWNGTSIKASIDGSNFDTDATALPSFTVNNILIGLSNLNAGSPVDSEILWAAAGTNTLSNADAATLHAFGDAGSAINYPDTSSPTFYWPADTNVWVVPSSASTGLTISDSIVAVKTPGGINRSISDTGLTITSTLVPRANRALTNTGLTVTSTTVTNVTRAKTDTAITISDTLVHAVIRSDSDTGLNISDSLQKSASHNISDTGLTNTDSISLTKYRSLTDTGINTPGAVTSGLSNNAEGGSNTVTPTTSDTGSGDPFNVISKGSASTLQYSSTLPAHDSLGYQFATRATSEANYVAATHTASADSYGRFYFALDAIPSAAHRIVQFRTTEGGVVMGHLSIRNTGALAITNNVNTVVLGSGATLSINHIYRIEWHVVADGTTNGTFHVYLYDGDDNTLPIWDSGDVAVTYPSSVSTWGDVRYGNPVAQSNSPTAAGFFYFDDLVTFSSSYPGPYIVSDLISKINNKTLSNTGLTNTDSITRTAIHSIAISDTGLTLSDTLVHQVIHADSDTGLTISDTLQKSASKSISDTGLTESDSSVTNRTRVFSDTGLTNTDSIARVNITSRSIADTGATITDSPASRRTRVFADTGLTNTDSIARTASHNISTTDTGLTESDSLVHQVVRSDADTGLTISDSIARTATHPRTITDTGATVTDSTVRLVTHFETDTGLTNTDSIARTSSHNISISDTGITESDTAASSRTRVLTDTGLTNTDSISRTASRNVSVSDTGLTETDTLVHAVVRSDSDTGLNISDSIARTSSHNISLTDTGAIITDSTVRLVSHSVSDTGLSSADSIARVSSHSISISDTGLTEADTAISNRTRVLSDTGLTNTDSLTRTATHPRSISDTGLTESDTLVHSATRSDADTGLNISDTTRKSVSKFVSDTGLTLTDVISTGGQISVIDNGISLSDSLAETARHFRTDSDTGLTISDALATSRARLASDTGLTESDSIARNASHNIALSDTGLNLTDTLAHAVIRSDADTGLNIGDSIQKTARHNVSDTGLTNTDSIASSANGAVNLTDTGLTLSDSIARSATHNRSASDTGLTISDSIASAIIKPRSLTDTGLTNTDSTSRTATHSRSITDSVTLSDALQHHVYKSDADTGLTISDTLVRGGTAFLSDTGLTVSDSITKFASKSISTTGLTLTDSVTNLPIFYRAISDTGLTESDSIAFVKTSQTIPVSDVGLTVSDFIQKRDSIFIADSGINITDVLTFVPQVIRGFYKVTLGRDGYYRSYVTRWRS